MKTHRTISVEALARRAGVTPRTARNWLREERTTQAAKAERLETAFRELGGAVLKKDDDPAAFLNAIMGLRPRRPVE